MRLTTQSPGTWLAGLRTRRPGPLLAVPFWVLLGVALVCYVVAVLALAFLAVLVATLRLFLTPPLRWVSRTTGVGRIRA